MSKIEKFEDLICWQKSRDLVKKIYNFTESDLLRKDFVLKDQFRRAGISIMLNISEGFARRTNKDFSKFLFIAHGSAAEIQSALYIAIDLNYITKDKFDEIYKDSEEVSKIISGLIKKLKT